MCACLLVLSAVQKRKKKIRGKASWYGPVTYRKLITLIAQAKTYLLSVHPSVPFIPSFIRLVYFTISFFIIIFDAHIFTDCVICGMWKHVCISFITYHVLPKCVCIFSPSDAHQMNNNKINRSFIFILHGFIFFFFFSFFMMSKCVCTVEKTIKWQKNQIKTLPKEVINMWGRSVIKKMAVE